MSTKVTIGPLALQVGILESQLRKLVKDGKVPFEPVRIGTVRQLFDVRDIDLIRRLAREAGYLQDAPEGAASAAC